MTTTPQTLTLAGEDYVVIPRDEYERLRAAADEDAAAVAAIPRVLDDPDETWVPAELVRRIVEGEHPARLAHAPRHDRPLAGRRRGHSELPLRHRARREARIAEGAQSLATALDVPLDDLV